MTRHFTVDFGVVSILGLIIFFIFVAVTDSSERKEFMSSCVKSGGTVVKDGRQYQCIPKEVSR